MDSSTISPDLEWQPPVIRSIEDTGLNAGFIQDLILKLMYLRGQVTGREIADSIHLSFTGVVSPY
ncbi:MAG: hypothetical protein M5U34_21560 [Chloroflexi bacterium]|nr:hypothetical protein [Chloroflexota bacterium]